MVSIILIKPQMGENIGATARIMLNFGITDLRIVSPRDGWPNDKAIEMSAGAKDVIKNAKIFDNTEEAIADLQYVYATTARKRDMQKDIVEPKEVEINGKTGIMFGPERSGLENSDLVFADKLISIPVNDEYSSINLAMSVGIICYEIGQQSFVKDRSQRELAEKSELQSMFEYLDEELTQKNFFQVAEKKPNMMNNIITMLNRAELSSQEVRTLRGILRALSTSPSKS